MLRKFYTFLVCAAMCSTIPLARASHVMGSDISFQNMGGDSFRVVLNVYRDCKGISLGFTSITMKPACGSSVTVTTTMGGGIDITPVCKKSCTYCTSTGCSFAFGTQRYTYTGYVKLASYSCCDFTFQWSQCCRNSGITTGAANNDYSIQATLNKCRIKGDAPKFEYDPIILTCKNQCVSRFQSAKSNAGDSLVYSMAEPMGAGTAIPYYSGYSYDAPFMYAGYPDKDDDSSACKGFRFNKHTGQFWFKPTTEDVTVYAIKVDQYQKDSGKWHKVSEVRQDVQTAVIECPSNRAPVITGVDGTTSSEIVVPVAKSFCFDIKSFDPDGDTLVMSWNKGISGGTFNVSSGVSPTGTFCWSAGQADFGKTFRFIVAVSEKDVCPMPTIIHRGFAVKVLDTLPPMKLKIKDSACGLKCYTVDAGSLTGLTYEWKVNGSKLLDKTQTLCYKFPVSGKYRVEVKASKTGIFPQTLFDSTSITYPVANAGADVSICYGDSVQLKGMGGGTYTWTPVQGISNTGVADPWVKPLKNQVYTLTITDAKGCKAKDSVLVQVKKAAVKITAPSAICAYDSATISVTGAHIYQWETSPSLRQVSGTGNAIVKPTVSTWYYVTATDTVLDCSTTDSVQVKVDTTCVWPGDANLDKKVSLNDLLSIGLAYGSVGSNRPGASLSWVPQLSPNWGKSLKGVDYKHIDCNGDGVINLSDTAGIRRNFGKTHKKGNILNSDPNGVPLYFSFSKDTFVAGESVTAQVLLGNSKKSAYGTYGVVVDHEYSGKWIADNTYKFSPECGLLCDGNGRQLQMSNRDANTYSGEDAIVRIDRKPTTGFGKLADITFTLKDTLTATYRPQGEWIYLRFTGARLIDNNGADMSYNAIHDSALVVRKAIPLDTTTTDTGSSVYNPGADRYINIYPNPAGNQMTIESPGMMMYDIVVLDMLGKVVSRHESRLGRSQAMLDVASLKPGHYIVTMQTNAGTVRKRLEIRR